MVLYTTQTSSQVHQTFDRAMTQRQFDQSVQTLETEKLKALLMLSQLRADKLSDSLSTAENERQWLENEARRLNEAHKLVLENLVAALAENKELNAEIAQLADLVPELEDRQEKITTLEEQLDQLTQQNKALGDKNKELEDKNTALEVGGDCVMCVGMGVRVVYLHVYTTRSLTMPGGKNQTQSRH